MDGMDFCMYCGTRRAAGSAASSAHRRLEIGDIVTWGRYEQDGNWNNGPEPIEWIVVAFDMSDMGAFLLSRYVIDAQPYHTAGEDDVTWPETHLCNWLNNEFLYSAFTEDERCMANITLRDDENGFDLFRNGVRSKCKVYIYTYGDWGMYTENSPYLDAEITPYAAAKTGGDATYWLRTPTTYGAGAATIYDGRLPHSHAFREWVMGVRPSIMVLRSDLEN